MSFFFSSFLRLLDWIGHPRGEVFKKKVSEMFLSICNVPLKATVFDKITNADADFYGFRNVSKNANSVRPFLN